MPTSTGGGAINIPIRIGMSPQQAQQVAQASGRSFGQAFQQGFAASMGGGNPLSRLWGAMQGGIASAGYGNYTGPRTPGMMAATYLWRGMLGRGTVSGMVGRIGATALGFGALGSLPQAIGEHITTAKTQDQALSDLNRRTGESLRTFSEFRSLVLDTGKDLGYTRDQIIQMTNAYVSGVGKMSSVALSRNLTGMMQLGKAYGIDPQAMVGLQTQVFRGGSTMSSGQLNAALAASVESGGMRGRENEVVTAIENLTSMLEKNLPQVGDLTPMLGLMTAMNASGNQGLMGQRGVELMGAVQNFTSGAGGGPRQNLMLQMIAAQRKAAGLPALDYAQMLYQSEEGIKNQGNLDALAYGVNNFLPKGAYGNVFLGQMLGISQHQAEALGPILASGGGGAGFASLTKAMGGRDVNAMALPFMARALGAGGLGGAMDVARNFAGTMNQTTANAFMSKAGQAKTPEEVAAVIAEYSDSTDQLLTASDKTTKAFVDFDNSLTDLAGQLNKILTESLKAWTNIFNLLGGGAGALIDVTGAASAASFAIYAMTAAAAASAIKGGVTGLGNVMFGTGGPSVLRNPTGKGPANAATRGGMGGRAAVAGSAILGGIELGSDLISGADPMESIVHRGLTTLTSILGGAGGAALGGLFGGGVGAVPGGALGAIGGNAGGEWLWENLIAPMFDRNKQGSTLTGAGATTVTGGNSTMFTAGRNPFDFRVTQPFGVPDQSWSGHHTGIDLGLPMGTSIAALQSGIVKGYRSEPNAGGNIMDLLMSGGETMSLAHLSKYLLKPGDAFQAGQAVALSGSTGGMSTGPHLHMEVKDALGRLMDPQQWYNNLRLRGQLDLSVSGGGADGQYKVPVTIGGGSLAGLLNGSYG